LLFFLFVLARRPESFVTFGHLPARWWKLAACWLGTRLGIGGTTLVRQLTAAKRRTGFCWTVELTPYQVDSRFWPRTGDDHEGDPLIFAVGFEHRDYAPLVEAALGLPVRLVIAPGSH
jgi:hypothetical protein